MYNKLYSKYAEFTYCRAFRAFLINEDYTYKEHEYMIDSTHKQKLSSLYILLQLSL